VDGTPFGRYRLIELLGRGGMGEVWRAHDTDTDRVVAIKLLPAHFSANEDFQRRFRREAHAAARLNSPHVVPIHYYGEIDGRLYVDMRLIEGRDLQAVLAAGPLAPARAVRIIEQVAEALQAAHEVGLLHRDVKPSNILLDRNDFAYLIDFGIARAADETRLTKSGNMIGTFAYIAPERLGTRAGEDARADIYSLACVLYECLTGHPPFNEDTTAGLLAAHLNTPPPQPSTTQPNVPPQVDQVIATGMAKDPDNRYATTVELADAARDAITTPIPRPEPTVPPEPPPTQKTPSPVTAPMVVHDRPSASPVPPAPRRAAAGRQFPRWVVPIASLAVATALGGGGLAIWQNLRHHPTSALPSSTAPTQVTLPEAPPSDTGCAGHVIARQDINHKSLGTVRLFLLIKQSPDIADHGCIAAVAGNGAVLPGIPIDVLGNLLAFARPVTDATGNAFVTYNPGRHDSVLVLVPTATGFQDIGWSDQHTHRDGRRAYYDAQLEGPGPDGNYVIRTSHNDCIPDCARGTTTTRDLHWNGSDYLP
jgi:serine/threonine protein kinase